ncbi:MAG: hypothetical protein H7832_11250 [Magnetococcus sp. DMHC-6]
MASEKKNHHSILFGSTFFFLLFFVAFLYWPGLSGGFLLDDFHNLQSLQTINEQPTLENILFSISGPTDNSITRPLSRASFVAQHNDWPTNPWMFKYVNLNLHLLNGSLLFWVFIRLGRFLPLRPIPNQTIALIATAIWLIHPLNLSTTLYVVQRMTQLAAFFTLLGLLAYLHGRHGLVEKSRTGLISGYFWISAGVALGGLFATLCKENGTLLPLFILVIEGTILSHTPRPEGPWRAWKAIFLLAPLASFILYFAIHWQQFFVFGPKEHLFTLKEHFLTEFRVLSDYLGLLFQPSLSRLGLFHDDYLLSNSLWHPPQTLWAILFIMVLFLIGFFLRNKKPVIAFGLLWFFAGHILETFILPLNIYFEHRNYFPATGLWFATVYSLYQLWEYQNSQTVRHLFSFGALALAALFSFLTYSGSTLWGNYPLQTKSWASLHPNSKQAQGQLVQWLVSKGEFEQAQMTLQKIIQNNPNDTGALLYWLQLKCEHPKLLMPDNGLLLQRMRTEFIFLPAMDELIFVYNQGKCPEEFSDILFSILKMQTEHQKNLSPYYQSKQHYYFAILEKKTGDIDKAITHLDAALRLHPSLSLGTQKVLWLSQHQRFTEALEYLYQLKSSIRGHPLTWMIYHTRIESLEEKLRDIIKEKERPMDLTQTLK